MKINYVIQTDVLVMGAGLAGITAAIKAGEQKVKVCLASSSNIFSGSSFFPGTWGFGLIGPENEEDEEDLVNTIKDIGMGMSDNDLVETLVSNITESIEEIKNWGVFLKDAINKDEKEFIPCFDHKNRNWNGILQEDAKKAFSKKLEEYHVNLLPNTEIIQVIKEGNKIIGVIAINKQTGPVVIECKSIVVASGGLGGLFKYRLNTSDISGLGQYIALNAGAMLINIEFMQMMLGFVSPCPKTIYNEKVYKYSNFIDTNSRQSIFDKYDEMELKRIMNIRSMHGPFTSRLDSKEIDIQIFDHFLKNESGVTLQYKQDLKYDQPEFIKIYFEWLKESKKLSIEDEVQVGVYAHASNGGIKINKYCETGVSGLFACGEATGGMHGADRIGGLSTANGLVFGRIAGKCAAEYAKKVEQPGTIPHEFPLFYIPKAREWINKLQQMNFESAMIYRKEEKILDSLNELKNMNHIINELKTEITETQMNMKLEITDTYELLVCLTLTEYILSAILLRKESRGSHYRVDYPVSSERYNQPIVMYQSKDGKMCCIQ